MEEDVLGTREEAVGERYTICTSCGKVVRRSRTRLDEHEQIDETRSEQEETCDECPETPEDQPSILPG